MTPDLELELTLELARASRAPRAADRRRVLEAVRRRMQSGTASRASLNEGVREGSGVYALPPRRGLLPGRRLMASSAWLQRMGGHRAGLARAWGARARWGRAALPRLVCVSVATGALGFWLGSQAAADVGSRELLHWLAPACR
jgi:hypothetical protein